MTAMANTKAIMLTMTTYGTWLRGDRRGWVDHGRILPADPDLEAVERQRMKHGVYAFDRHRLADIGGMTAETMVRRLGLTLLALTVQTWHVHLVIGRTSIEIGEVAKRAKESVRWGLRPGRPIWSDGYDKRYCFDERAVRGRIRYVERHNEAIGLSARPLAHITDVEEYLGVGQAPG